MTRPLPPLCAWCSKPVTGISHAWQDDLVVWHPDCFVKFLAHKDELMGITR